MDETGLAPLEREGGWNRELESPGGKAVPELPARRTRLLHIPMTVSFIGSRSTWKRRTGSYVHKMEQSHVHAG